MMLFVPNVLWISETPESVYPSFKMVTNYIAVGGSVKICMHTIKTKYDQFSKLARMGANTCMLL